ncbi:LLM class flavin-dependent oxidoreductase [Nakamurella sp. YIM 132087]|uniref:LLM class flavin-dependent oxidoreductase n=1 Tax=Nakamurella alba TaxID=2665158 RepID=A0A7K1FFZ8_9ACTN|nr:LLM class flavin-dependent oxidoreductase [Nakamurella alba]MTD13032.1 LLM class flavin-dependent oxidoreductase [Nakamurella alba]
MRITYQMFMANPANLDDHDFYAKELHLAELADELGFDGIWCVEHHFDSEYSMSPDNLMILAYLAGRTKNATLTTGGVILPWNDPLRVAEKISLLDILSGGRAQLGIGRGLSKEEYDTFGIDMNTSRQRSDESLTMVLDGLRSGTVRGSGPFYPQPEAPLRPRPMHDMTGDVVNIAMSADSRLAAAENGTTIASFAQGPVEVHLADIEEWRAKYRELQGTEPPLPVMTDHIYCSADAAEAEATSREYVTRHFLKTMQHYGFDKANHFDEIKGYQSYAAMADALQAAGKQAACDGYWAAQITGTPEQIVARIKERYEAFGDYNQNFGFSYGGMPHDKIEASLRLFAAEVLPALREAGLVATPVPA